MVYRIERTPEIEADLRLIFGFLVEAPKAYGEPMDRAVSMAGDRLMDVRTNLMSLSRVPHIGALQPDLGTNVRRVNKDRATFYFKVDDAAKVVRVMAVFYGGQDHQRRMLVRLTGRGRTGLSELGK